MKYVLLGFLLSLFYGCCKNDEKYSLNEIVQTDESGNIVGGDINSNDWKLVDFNSSSFFNDVEAGLRLYYMDTKFDTLKIKKDCKTDSFNIKFYSNPMKSNKKSYARIYLSTKIKDMAYGYKNKLQNGIISSEGGISDIHIVNSNTILMDIPYPQYNFGQDFELYFCVIDSNNCGYYFSGKVKVE
ncbi:MAG: hypothetical protein JNL75_05280 [Chitinophagales bacterium]|nr:hypothetical protein [Chitinophagales bacterium]